MINYLKKLISGNVSLAKTYWLFGVLPNFIFNIIYVILVTKVYVYLNGNFPDKIDDMAFANNMLNTNIDLQNIEKAIIGLFCIMITWGLIWGVSVFNSANNYKGSAFWKYLAIIISGVNFASILILIKSIFSNNLLI